MNRPDDAGSTAKLSLRTWVDEVNALGARFGHEAIAGPANDPDPEYVDRWRAGETPAETVESDFASHIAAHGRPS